MTSKTTPSLNEASKRRTKRPTAGFNSRYAETPSASRKLKFAPLNAKAKTFYKKNTITFEKKSSPFSEDIDSHDLTLKEETRLQPVSGRYNFPFLREKRVQYFSVSA